MSQQDPWADFRAKPATAPPPSPPPAQRSGGGLRPIYSAPDPQRSIDNARDDRGEQRDETRLDLSLDEAGRQRENDRLGRVDIYRKEFLTDPIAREFRDLSGATQQIVTLATRKTDDPGPGDIALITSYMKVLDPGSVVREGEFANAENAGGVPTKIRNLYNNFVSGGKLTPEMRREFAATALSIYDAKRGSYNRFAETYRGLIAEAGGDPDANGVVLAEELTLPGGAAGFVPPKAGERGPGGVIEPRIRGGFAEGTQVELGVDQLGRDNSFDRLNYLQDEYGLQSSDESIIAAMWQANSGNKELTVDGVRQWYESRGYPLPTPEDLQSGVEWARQGGNFKSQFNLEDMQAEYERMLDAAIEQAGSDPNSATEAGTVGAASGAMLYLNDEMRGALAAAKAALTGGNPVTAYEVERDIVRRFRERAEQESPTASFIGEIAGGLATGGVGIGRAAAQGGVRAAAKEGAAIGAAAGFGAGEGLPDSVAQAAVGAPIGAAAGAVGQKVVSAAQNMLARLASTRAPSAGRETIEAADAFNAATGAHVRPIPADVGGPTIRRMTGGAAQSPISVGPIVRSAQAVTEEAGAGVDNLAMRAGAVAETRQAAGDTAIRGADKSMKQAKVRVDAKYAKAERLTGDTRVPLTNAMSVAEREIAELADTPGGVDSAAELRRIVGNLEGDYSPKGIKRFRKNVRDRLVKDGLRGSEIEAAALRIVQAANEDIEDGLVRAGKAEAAKAYRDASSEAEARFSLIDETFAPILGSKGERSGEQVFAAINRMSKGDAANLAKFMRALPADEAATIRATMIQRMGRTTNDGQDTTDLDFNLSTFLTNWTKKTSDPAKNVLFDGETRAALDNLARVAKSSQEAQRYANSSNTAGGLLFNGLIGGGGIVGATMDVTAAAAVTAGAAIPQLVARSLGSPAFARWLAKMPKMRTEAETRAHIRRLSRIAANDNVIGAEVLDLQRWLMGQVPAAAEEENTSGRTGTEQVPQ